MVLTRMVRWKDGSKQKKELSNNETARIGFLTYTC